MITLAVTFDTQTLNRSAFEELAQGGTLLGVTGLLNLHWEEFSALDAARDLNLHDVIWETTRDDTPGSLTFFFRYDTNTLPEIQALLLDSSVLEYEVCQMPPRLIADRDRRPPNNRN